MRKEVKVILGFVFISLFVASGFVISGYWKEKNLINKIELTGNVNLSKDDIFKFAKLTDSLLIANKFPLEVIEMRISKHPNIKSVNASIESGVLIIVISEREPFALVIIKNKLLLIDDLLNLYEYHPERKNIDLPVISGLSDSLEINNISSSDLKKLKIARYIISRAVQIDKLLYRFISEINFSDNKQIVIFSNENATEIYFFEYSCLKSITKSYNTYEDIDVTSDEFRKMIDKKLIYLSNFYKKVLIYRGYNAYQYIDMRYDDILLVKNKIEISN